MHTLILPEVIGNVTVLITGYEITAPYLEGAGGSGLTELAKPAGKDSSRLEHYQ